MVERGGFNKQDFRRNAGFESIVKSAWMGSGEKRRADVVSMRSNADKDKKVDIFSLEDHKLVEELMREQAVYTGRNKREEKRQLELLLENSSLLNAQAYVREMKFAALPDKWAAKDRAISASIQRNLEKMVRERAEKAEAEKAGSKVMSEREIAVIIWKLQIDHLRKNKVFSKVEDFAKAIIDALPSPAFRGAMGIVVLALVQIACAIFSPTPTPEFNPAGSTDAPAGEVTGLPSEAATEAASGAETEQPSNVQEIAFQDNGEPISTYGKFAVEIGVAPATGTDFGNRIGTEGLQLIDEKYNDFYKNDYQIPYAIPKGTADNIQSAWIDIKTTDASGKESYLNVTVEGGNACAKEVNQKFDTTGTRLDLTASDGIIARLIDKDGKAVCGVDLSANNPNERQWKVLDENGMLVDQQGEIIPTPNSSDTVSVEESPILISNPEVILAMVKAYKLGEIPFPADFDTEEQSEAFIDGMVEAYASGEIPFPSDMSKEQYSDFIDSMNDYVGRKPIYVETTNNAGGKIVLYFDIAKNKMIELPGTYAENKAIIDQNALEVFVKIGEEPGTGNVQFTNSKGELVTSPNSADTNFGLRIDASNYKNGLVDLPTVIGDPTPGAFFDNVFASGGKMDETLVPVILMEDTAYVVVRNQGGWTEYHTLNVMSINVNEKTGKKNYGISFMAGGSPDIFFGKEGGTLDGHPSKNLILEDSDDIKQFEAGAVYYICMAKNQQVIWDESLFSDIDALQGTNGESDSFENATNNNMPKEGNIIVAAPIFIKKK